MTERNSREEDGGRTRDDDQRRGFASDGAPRSDEADQSHVFNQGYGTGYGGSQGEGGYGAGEYHEQRDDRDEYRRYRQERFNAEFDEWRRSRPRQGGQVPSGRSGGTEHEPKVGNIGSTSAVHSPADTPGTTTRSIGDAG